VNLETGLKSLLQPSSRIWLEQTIIPAYLKQRRWFASKDKVIDSIRLTDVELIALPEGDILLTEVRADFNAVTERYQLPLGVHLRSDVASGIVEQLKLCDVKIGGQDAVLTDAFTLDVLPLGLLACMRKNVIIELAEGQLRCTSLERLKDIEFVNDPEIRRLAAEQSNSSLVIGGRIIMKLIRRVMIGINPEVEMVRYLTEQGYANTPPLLGEVQRVGPSGDSCSILVAQEFVPNQGDGWDYSLKFIRDRTAKLSDYAVFASIVGTRLAELHSVLARPTDNTAFAPMAASEADTGRWSGGVVQQLHLAFQALSQMLELPMPASRDRDFVLSHRDSILTAIPMLAAAGIGSLMTRIHGDFHLGQILVASDDAYIIDFEGEPAKPLADRRSRASPMRDVAGLVRSLHYAVAASDMPQDAFFDQMSAVFLNAYRRVERIAIPRWLSDETQEAALLDLFLIEKSAYEICYEAANRPTWVKIPLRGLAEIMARVLQLDAETHDA
jgi:maltose alpha-D-glucosyltransferase/alpha-amylase